MPVIRVQANIAALLASNVIRLTGFGGQRRLVRRRRPEANISIRSRTTLLQPAYVRFLSSCSSYPQYGWKLVELQVFLVGEACVPRRYSYLLAGRSWGVVKNSL
jgi:hypothetical protein